MTTKAERERETLRFRWSFHVENKTQSNKLNLIHKQIADPPLEHAVSHTSSKSKAKLEKHKKMPDCARGTVSIFCLYNSAFKKQVKM